MSVTFTKLFSSITASTIWAARDQTRIVWITMLAMADQHGRVWASIPGLANIARVSIPDTEVALAELMGPDKYSRTKENEGRRLEEIDGGWRLLNHAKYRAIRDEESIKESKRRYINSRREAEKLVVQAASASAVEQNASTVEPCRTESNSVDCGRANTEAEAEAKTEIQKSPPAARVPPADAGQRAAKKCPESFEVTDELAAWAAKKAPGVDIQSETDKLRDHTFANARKDWEGTWRNWMRKAFEDLPRKANSESFRERDIRLAAERVRDMTGGLCHDRKATGEKPRELLPFERGYVETIEGEAHEQLSIV